MHGSMNIEKKVSEINFNIIPLHKSSSITWNIKAKAIKEYVYTF